MTAGSQTLRASYAFCRRIARRSGSNFYPAMLLLSPARRQAMEALYAFLRHTDDLADADLPLAIRQDRLERWRSVVAGALNEAAAAPDAPPAPLRHPTPSNASAAVATEDGPTACVFPDDSMAEAMLPALAHTVRRFAIPEAYLWAVLEGVSRDLAHRGFETFEELAEYCRLVASAVGRACLCIWGAHREEALPLADQCGVAFQLTNILRDMGEDAARGRVYLPRADLAASGYPVEALLRREHQAGLENVVLCLAERARVAYRIGADLFDLLDGEGQRVFGLMFSVYGQLLEEVVRRRRDLLRRRIRLAWWRKAALAARWTLLAPRKPALA